MKSHRQSARRSTVTAAVRSIIRSHAAAVVAGSATLFVPAVAGIAGLTLTGTAHAQDYTSGVLNGRVSGSSGQAIAGAEVTVSSDQGLTRKTTTDANGAFRVPALPAGAYDVAITKEGISPLKQRTNVAPGGSQYEFTVFAVGETVNEVLVQASAIRDFASTETGLSVDVQDLASRVPIGRSVNAITLLTPGASLPDATINASSRRNQALSSLAGTSAAESSYYVNGLNVTDQRTFLGYSDLPFQFLQTVETKTGGYSAEYGRGTGGVVNMVTRSGTNEFEFGATVTWSPDDFREKRGLAFAPAGTNLAGQNIYNQVVEVDTTTYTVYAGGPIIKDRLFFFGVYEGRDSDQWSTALFTSPLAPSGTHTNISYDDPFYGAKIDFLINDNHRLEGTYWSDETTTSYDPWAINRQLVRTATSPSWVEESGGTNYIAKYTGVFTDWFTLSALYGKVTNSFDDNGEAVDFPAVQNIITGAYANTRRFNLFDLSGEDVRETYRVDADFYFNAMGEHHLRVGYDREDLNSKAQATYNGGGIYYFFPAGTLGAGEAAPGAIYRIVFSNFGEFEAEQTALYIQDSWQITPNFNLQVGLRNDQYDYKNIQGESYIKIDDQIAPRIGFSWDPFGSGRDRVYGSIGDYYLPIALNTSIRASSGEIYTEDFYQAVAGTNAGPIPIQLDANGVPVLGAQLLPTNYASPPTAPDPRSVTEKDLDPMYEREFSLGYEHTFEGGMFNGWTGGVRLVYRNLESTIEDTAIGDAMVRYCVRTNTACGQNGPGDQAFSSIFPYVLINPGDAATVFIDLEGDGRANPDGTPNPNYSPREVNLTVADLALPEAKRKYKAVEFTFERPFDGRWQMKGSYVLADSKGNYEGGVKSDVGQTDTSITQDFDHASNQINSDGYLPNHRRHTFKLWGNYMIGDRFSIGANMIAQSGRKYGCIGYTPLSVDPLAPQAFTPSGWYCPDAPYTGNGGLGTPDSTKVPTPRGSKGETPWVYQVDLSLGYKVFEGETGSLTARADIFNVFDANEATRVVEQGEIRRTSGATGYPAAYYGQVRNYQTPRFVRLSLSYDF